MARRYGEELRRLVSSGRYDNYEDFAVILSPALEDLEVPVARAPADSFLRVLVKICHSSQQKTISPQNVFFLLGFQVAGFIVPRPELPLPQPEATCTQ